MGFLLCLYGEYIDYATIIDVMEWMINTQLGRRNLPPAQRISVVDKFKKKIQEQAKGKQSEAGKEFGNGKSSSSPNGEKLNIHTDKELAKMAGVGTGTIARYNRVMKSDDEAKQRKVAVEYVKLCGYKNGEIGNGRKKDSHNGKATQLTLDQIAEQLGTSKRNLQRALTIERNLTESMKQLLDDGSANFLNNIFAKNAHFLCRHNFFER